MTTNERPSRRRQSSRILVAAVLAIGPLAMAPATANAQRPEMRPEAPTGEPAPRTQQGRVEPRLASSGSHLHLVLRVTQSGSAEVIAATEVSGEVVLSDDARGDFLYEVAVGGRVLVAQGVVDPFEWRSFPRPGGSALEGHHFHREESATLVVKVPDAAGVREATDGLTVRLYRLRPGTPAIERVNPAELERLKRGANLELVADTVYRP